MPSKELIDGEWMKICSHERCDLAGQYQPVSKFAGRHNDCNRCRYQKRKAKFSKETKQQRKIRLEEQRRRVRDHYNRNKDKLNKKRREKYATSPEFRKQVSDQRKRWEAKNGSKERNKRINKKRWEKYGRTEEYRKRRREYYQNNELARMKNNVSRSIRSALQNQGAKKDYKTFQALSYTPQELKEHIENQFSEKMNWDNYGDYWHIDHIIPQAALPYESIEDENFQKCWALENLRPLEATENMSKGSLYEGERHTYANK
jgi:hypothetical protein